MSDSLLLTGATGFLGMELVARWLAEDDAGPDVACCFDDRRARDLVGRRAPPTDRYLAALLRYGDLADWGRRRLTREAAQALVAAAS